MSFRAGYPDPKLPQPHRIHVWYSIFSYIYHENQPNVGKYIIHGSYGNWTNVGWTSFFPLIFAFRRWKGAAAIQQILKTHWSLLNRLRMVGLEARFLRFWLARKQQEMTEDLGFVELELKIWSNMFGWWVEFLTNVKPSESSVFSWEWNAHWLWRLSCTQPHYFGPNISRTIWTLRMVFNWRNGMV